MTHMSLPILTLKGSPFELGYEHGKQAQKAIRRNFEFYLGFWHYWSGAGRERILQEAKKFIPSIEKADPDLMEELKGISRGAAMELEEIVALNSRYELGYAYMRASSAQKASEGCTAFALLSEATANGHIYVGQNWDYRPGLQGSCMILRLTQSNKPSIIMHTEAGIIGHKGFNSAGLGVCFNVIKCAKDVFKPGLPLWLKARGILNSEALPDCIRFLLTFEGPNSVNIVIAHRDGEAIDVECTPDDNFFLSPQNGILTHTNHFQSPNLRCKDTGKSLLPDTVIRNQRAFRLFQNRRGTLDGESIKEVMGDHFGNPNSICRHRDPRLGSNEQWETLTSMIMDLSDGTLFYTDGPPCSHPHEKVCFD
jgi:isopenicillin-N N-acyltransferase like protein